MEDVYSPVLYEEREVTIRGLEGGLPSDSRSPPQARLQRVSVMVALPEGARSFQNFIASSDTSMRVLNPTISYLGVLVGQVLNGEASRLRVVQKAAAWWTFCMKHRRFTYYVSPKRLLDGTRCWSKP